MKLLIAIITLAAAAAASAQNTLVISPSSGDFGNVTVGKTSTEIIFTVTNDTISTMGYLGYTNLGEFKLQAGTCHLVNGEPMLNPGQSCAFNAVFMPTKVGTVNGNLSIKTSSGTFNVPMSGTGVPSVETRLYSFCPNNPCTDGSIPQSDLILDDAGNLYGTTVYGGDQGSGTVFKLDSTGHETVLYSFCTAAVYCLDGGEPYAGLLLDDAGNLYGTTLYGGTGGNGGSGTVFKVDKTGHHTVLYNFCSAKSCTDGASPQAGLIRDAAGNLYGTTTTGGAYEGGTVFKLDNKGHETVLYSFCSLANCADGSAPQGRLVRDTAGNLYGAAGVRGAHGYGAVFKLDTTGHESLLYSFCSLANCADGSLPNGVIQDAEGNFYGTTYAGGVNGDGTVFKLDNTGHETVLYSFCSVGNNCTDGKLPVAGLIRDAAGNLYGTTPVGGINPYRQSVSGTAFKLDTTGHETVLYSFCTLASCEDGVQPLAGLVQDPAGNLYGTTAGGGFGNEGTVFKLTLPSN